MEWNNTNIAKNTKIELALAALMFFSPLIKSELKKRQNLGNEDKQFIYWFIKLWYLNIVMLIITIMLELAYYSTTQNIFNIVGNISLVLLAVSLIIGSIFAISERSITKPITQDNNSMKITTKNDILDIILKFIPLYNVYLWYEKHDFEWNDIALKESLILWWGFSILLIFPLHNLFFITYLVLILLMVLINIFGLNIWEKYDKFINNLFKKNPEEARWWFIWIITAPFSRSEVNATIETKKQRYSFIVKLDHKQVLLEFIILSILVLIWIILWIYFKQYSIIIWVLLILWRYAIMLIKWKHITHIPIIKELTNIFFTSKVQQWKD